MKPENPADAHGSRVTHVTPCGAKNLKLILDGQYGGAVVLRCQGRITFGPEARALTEIISEVLPVARVAVVDLTEVATMDSAGLGEIVLLHMWAKAAGYTLKFASPSRYVRQLLELTNLASVLEEYGTVSEALAAMHQEEIYSA